MKRYTVDLCWRGEHSWTEESEHEQGEYYKVSDVDEEIKKLREALELICAFRAETKLTILPIIRIKTLLSIAGKALKENN